MKCWKQQRVNAAATATTTSRVGDSPTPTASRVSLSILACPLADRSLDRLSLPPSTAPPLARLAASLPSTVSTADSHHSPPPTLQIRSPKLPLNATKYNHQLKAKEKHW
ncbi:unnamed protein product [Linum trigynum]|uniref:Uncharacterized protein n=1 Tax=Linum trigynum TaxID=586398 RepID=A0AAV2E3B1_9ROSI